MQQTTLGFLIKKSNERIVEVCLAMKKRGFGAGRWNGFGGKVEVGESIEQALIREAREELNIELIDFTKVAKLKFINPDPNHPLIDTEVFLIEKWDLSPTESEEMSPKWFKLDKIPYSDMWVDDILWLPKVLNQTKIIAEFKFLKESIESYSIEEVLNFD